MIFLYTGTPGSGKSIHATVQIDLALKRGMDVISTYKIKLDPKKHKGRFVHIDIYDMNIRFFLRYSQMYLERNKEHQCLIVIDEASRIFNPKNVRKDLVDWLEFLPMHRHFGYDMVIVAQNENQIDKQVLAQIETEIRHRNIMNYGLKGLMIMLLMRKKFVAIEVWRPNKEVANRQYIGGRKRICKMYDHMGMFDELCKKYLDDMGVEDNQETDRVGELRKIAQKAEQERREHEKKNNGVSSGDDNKPVVVCESSDTKS